MVSVSPVSGAVVSLFSTMNVVAELSSSTVKVSSAAVGGAFTDVKVVVTGAVAVLRWPSDSVYVNVVVPLKLAAGVKRTFEVLKVTVPLAGCVTAVIVKVSPVSGAVVSLSSTRNVETVLSSSTVKVSSAAVGGAF